MKKLIVVAVLFALIFGAAWAVDVSSIDGFLWVRMSDEAKVYMVAGYLLGMSSVALLTDGIYAEALSLPRSETIVSVMITVQKIGAWSEYTETVNDIVASINSYYTTSGNMLTPLNKVIPILFKSARW